MNTTQHLLELKSRPILRLSEIERLIRKHRIIVPPPSRRSLMRFCEDGTFETACNPPKTIGWLVYEDSFLKWVEDLNGGG